MDLYINLKQIVSVKLYNTKEGTNLWSFNKRFRVIKSLFKKSTICNNIFLKSDYYFTGKIYTLDEFYEETEGKYYFNPNDLKIYQNPKIIFEFSNGTNHVKYFKDKESMIKYFNLYIEPFIDLKIIN